MGIASDSANNGSALFMIIKNGGQVKDVRVPENLQRAMAAEAEAARNARAKVMMINIIVVIIIRHNQIMISIINR